MRFMRWKCYKKTKYLDDHILKSEEIIIYRQKKRLRNIFFFLILLIMVIWSVDVTIVEDTDWETYGEFIRRFIQCRSLYRYRF
ncbi:MAG: hypothetical protein CM15mP45_04220 [Deltaproteobacteria bacterium]|nr:MAG: hypothetical protein CM15mP45_04220 [Deltaproteobacteria bacterium]